MPVAVHTLSFLGSVLIWILVFGVGCLSVLNVPWAQFDPGFVRPNHSIRNVSALAKASYVQSFTAERIPVRDAAIPDHKVAEFLLSFSKVGSSCAVLNHTPNNVEGNRVTGNQDSLFERLRLAVVRNRFKSRAESVEANSCCDLNNPCRTLTNVFYFPEKPHIAVVKKTRFFRLLHLSDQPRSFGSNHVLRADLSGFCRSSGFSRLLGYDNESEKQSPCLEAFPTKESIPTWRVPLGLAYIAFGVFTVMRGRERICWFLGMGCGILGVLFVLTGYIERGPNNEQNCRYVLQHDGKNVSQKLVDVIAQEFRNAQTA